MTSASTFGAAAETRFAFASAPLTSVDWRFLLPAANRNGIERVLLWRGRPGIAERLIQTDTAQVVDGDRSSTRPVDAVIALSAAPSDVRRAYSLLRPGGVLYLEIRRSFRAALGLDLRRLRRHLRRTGFRGVLMYGVYPSFIQPMVYIPLEARAAWLWYLATVHQPRTAWAWMRSAAIRAAGGSRLHAVRYFMTHVAVTAVKAVDDVDVSPPSVLGHPSLRSMWGGQQLHPLVLAGQRTVMFPFRRADSKPLAAVKIPKLREQNGPTANEQHTLRDIRRLTCVPAQVPEPLMLLRSRGVNLAVESILPGKPIERSSTRWSCREATRLAQLRATASWLTDFHRRTELGRSAWGASDNARWLSDPVERYRRLFGEDETSKMFFARVRRYAEQVSRIPVPTVRQHRDFRPANVLYDRGTIRVIDWEGCCAGPPLCDLLHFVGEWHAAIRHLRRGTARTCAFADLFLKPTHDRVARTIAEVTVRYLDTLRLDSRFVPLLIVCTWVELAVRHAERHLVIGSPGAPANDSLDFICTLMAQSDALFGTPPDGSLLAVLAGA